MKTRHTPLPFAAGWLLLALLTINSPALAEDEARNEALLQVMAEVLKELEGSATKPVHYFRTLRYVAEAQAKLGDRETARATLRQAAHVAAGAKQSVVRRGNTVSYGLSSASQLQEVGHAQIELRDKEGARETLRLAVQAKDEEESNHGRIETLSRIAKDFTALGAHDEALQVAGLADINRAAGGDRDEQAVVPEVAGAHAAAGDIDGAFAIIDGIAAGGNHPRIKQGIIGRSLWKIAKAVETADRATARAALEQVRRRLDDAPWAEDKYFALTDLAFALGRIGDYGGAMRAARAIGEGPSGVNYDMRDGQSYTMLVVANYRREAGDRDGARKILREAYETTKVVPESRGKSGRLAQVASAMIAADDLTGAMRCVEDMRPGQRSETLAGIALAQKKYGDAQAAQATFRRALDDLRSRGETPSRPGIDRPVGVAERPHGKDQWNDQIARETAKIQAMMGDYTVARKTANAITDPVRRAWALVEIARVQAAAGDARGAFEWCRKLELTPKTQNPLVGVIEGISEFAKAQAKQAP